MNLMRSIYQNHGVKGIYKGSIQTILREGIGNSVYFLTYEQMVRMYIQSKQIRREDIPTILPLVGGGLAGLNSWMINYPVDVVKTKFQSQCLINPEFTNSMQIYRSVYNETGIQGFFKGFAPCGIRSIPVNAAGFLLYEKSSHYMNGLVLSNCDL